MTEVIEHPESGKVATELRIKQLKKIVNDKIFVEYPKWEKEKRILDSLPKAFEQLNTISSNFQQEFQKQTDAFPESEADSPSFELLNKIRLLIKSLDLEVEKFNKSISETILECEKKTQLLCTEWNTKYQAEKAKYFSLLEKVQEESIKKAQGTYRSLETRMDTIREYEKTNWINEHHLEKGPVSKGQSF